jgi:hypothetical protein
VTNPASSDLVDESPAASAAASLRDPSPEEMAAITAAYEALWPKPVAVVPAHTPPPRWRFSGRWWTKPVPLSRDRP